MSFPFVPLARVLLPGLLVRVRDLAATLRGWTPRVAPEIRDVS